MFYTEDGKHINQPFLNSALIDTSLPLPIFYTQPKNRNACIDELHTISIEAKLDID